MGVKIIFYLSMYLINKMNHIESSPAHLTLDYLLHDGYFLPLELYGVLPDDPPAPSRVLQLLQQFSAVPGHIEHHRHFLALVPALHSDGNGTFFGLCDVVR